MLLSILKTTHNTTTLLFGIFISAFFLGMKKNVKNMLTLTLFFVVSGLLYLACFLLFGENATTQAYPLLIHLPLVVFDLIDGFSGDAAVQGDEIDTVLGMDLAHGGHLSHGSPVNISGKYFNVLHYGVSKETGLIDYDEVERIAAEHHPKLIIAGASAYPRIIDFARFREICDRCGAFFMVDMAHIAGLVAAGLHPSPVPYADVVTSTTHKTLRGPRGGLILCREQYAKQIDKAIFPGTQGGPLEHIIAAKAVAFGEAMTEDFINYQKQIIKNAKAFENALKREGFELVSDGTDNHLILIDLRGTGITGRELEKRLDEVHITVNKNAIPFDPEKPTITSGIRVGTPAVTSRGFNEADMVLVAHLIRLAATDFEANREYIVSEAGRLCAAHPIYD